MEPGQDPISFLLAQHPRERRVLSQISRARCARGECIEDTLNRPSEQALPLVEPTVAAAGMDRSKLAQVLFGLRQDGLRVEDEFARDRMAEPETSRLISGYPQRARSKGIDVGEAHAAVGPGRHERQVASIAEVHDVLARRSEEPGGLTGRDLEVLVDRAPAECVRAHRGLWYQMRSPESQHAAW